MITVRVAPSFRRRREWRSLEPQLTTASTEDSSIAFDMAIPLPNEVSSILNILLLWSSDSLQHNKERICSRVPKQSRPGDQQVALLVDNRANRTENTEIWQHFSVLQDQ